MVFRQKKCDINCSLVSPRQMWVTSQQKYGWHLVATKYLRLKKMTDKTIPKPRPVPENWDKNTSIMYASK